MTEHTVDAEAIPAPAHLADPGPDAWLCANYRARLESLYRSEVAALRAWLARRVDFETADDLAHETFLRAARCHQLGELHNPRGFLRRIALNLIIDRARRQSHLGLVVPLFDGVDAATAPDQEAGLHERETLAAYESSLAQLPPRTARIFAMSRVEKKTYREISEELMIAPGTVEYHMMRALRCVRSRLAEARGDRPEASQI